MQNYSSKFKSCHPEPVEGSPTKLNGIPKLIRHDVVLVVLFIITFNFSLLTFNLPKVSAQSTFIRVAPATQNIKADPGKEISFQIKFINSDALPINGYLKAADFIVENNNGVPTFLEGPTKLSPKYAAASWVTLPYDRMTIASSGQVLIQAKVKIPSNATPGGRYFAVFFEPAIDQYNNDASSKEQAITPRVAALVYLRINGPIKDDAIIKQFTVPNFSEYGPVEVTTEILNRGNYHIRPIGNITVTNIFGNIVDQQKIDENNIFPEASRIFSNKLGEKWLIGKFKITFNATYGESGKILTATIYSWVFPWKIAAVIILAIVIFILIFFVIFRNMRRREEAMEEKIEELEEKIKGI